MAGIYIHIPFCKRKCVYCDFYSTALLDRYSASYLERALAELKEERGFLQGEKVETLYFGGGTPSLYPAEDIGRIIDAVKEIYGGDAPLSEITLEANPEDLTPDYLTQLRRTGVDRLSIGIQSLDDGMLRFMKRRHDSRRAVEAVGAARRAGFDNISIDLIFGIPGMSHDMWESTLARAVELSPEHISAYHLTFEGNTILNKRLRQGQITEVDEQESRRQFLTLHDTLHKAGYEHYEVSNFSLPGCRSRHNSSYWTGTPYLGIGPGAHSYDGHTRRWNDMTVQDYVGAGPIRYGSEKLTPDDMFNELVMTSLRRIEGIDTEQMRLTFPEQYARFEKEASRLADSGLLHRTVSGYRIAPENFLISDSVIARLFV